jgi:hypothetical protein
MLEGCKDRQVSQPVHNLRPGPAESARPAREGIREKREKREKRETERERERNRKTEKQKEREIDREEKRAGEPRPCRVGPAGRLANGATEERDGEEGSRPAGRQMVRQKSEMERKGRIVSV